MLIVTADDFGSSPRVTDLIVDSFDRGLISATTAMVWMPDTTRAAELAHERGIPVGLHLNLTLPFRGEGVPEPARKLQAELATRFTPESWTARARIWRRDPRIQEAIYHQLAEFRTRFGEPTQIDGHHHVHLHPAILPRLPRELPIRPVPRAPLQLGERGDRRDRLIRRDFLTADGCVAFEQIHPALGGVGLGLLDFAEDHVLEVVAHVQDDGQRGALESRGWRAALGRQSLGSYRELSPR